MDKQVTSAMRTRTRCSPASGGFLEKLAERFSASVDLTRFSVYGEPSDEARKELAALGPIYLGTFGGFVR